MRPMKVIPMRISEMISTLEAPVYVERVAITDAKNTNKVRRAVRKALQNQIDNKGFSLVEVLSVCPSGWKMSPVQSKQWLTDYMIKQFPLGVFRDRTEEIPVRESHRHIFHFDGIREPSRAACDPRHRRQGESARARISRIRG